MAESSHCELNYTLHRVFNRDSVRGQAMINLRNGTVPAETAFAVRGDGTVLFNQVANFVWQHFFTSVHAERCCLLFTKA